jgi:PAS domain S-box-containing protein
MDEPESHNTADETIETFRNSFALFDSEKRLVDWDAGFALEWSFVASQLKPGIPFADLVRAAISDPIALQFMRETFGVEDTQALLANRITRFGQPRTVRHQAANGRIMLVDEQPTEAGGVRRISRDITEEYLAEAALTAAEQKLKAADSDEGVFVEIRRTPDGSYHFPPVPAGLARLLNLPPETVGMDPMVVHTRMARSEEDDARNGTILERSAQTLEVCTLEYGIRDGLGRQRRVRQSMLPRREPDGTVIFSGIMRDITRERQAEDRVELLQSVVVRSTDSIVIFEAAPPPSHETKTLYINPRCEELFGLRAADVIGRPASAMQKDKLSRYASKLLEEALARGDGAPVEFEAHGSGGRLFWVEGRVAVVQRFDSGAFRWVVMSRDVTDRRRAQSELLEAKNAAEAGNRAKSNFLANMSHELRTPLNAIIGFSELIVSGVERNGWTDTYTEYLADILQSGRHLLDLINTILDLSKIEAGSLSLDVDEIDLRELIHRSRDLIAGMAEAGGVMVEMGTPEESPRIEGDFLKLKQVLLNVLSNAVKFTPAGGKVTIGARVRADTVVITVTDTGCGISAGDLERVLLPFVQADNTLARKFHGSGLGLPIAQQFCVLHCGRLEIASKEGKGTTVTVTLPLRQPGSGAGTYTSLRSIA